MGKLGGHLEQVQGVAGGLVQLVCSKFGWYNHSTSGCAVKPEHKLQG
jgi:hypothetical protein